MALIVERKLTPGKQSLVNFSWHAVMTITTWDKQSENDNKKQKHDNEGQHKTKQKLNNSQKEKCFIP